MGGGGGGNFNGGAAVLPKTLPEIIQPELNLIPKIIHEPEKYQPEIIQGLIDILTQNL